MQKDVDSRRPVCKLAANQTTNQMNILSTANAKIRKGEKKGYKTFGIHLAPATLSGYNTCSHASEGCAEACLNTSGMGVFSNVQEARINKTLVFFKDRQRFLAKLHKEIGNKIKNQPKKGFVPVFRLNLTSDLSWESIKFNGKSMMEHYPDAIFYDYTKNPKRMLKYINGELPKNYHLTFSRSESNETHCDIIKGCGGNVAVVFHNSLPKTYKGKTVIDGDSDDLRFLDPKNCIVGLVAKGKGKKDDSGFVITH